MKKEEIEKICNVVIGNNHNKVLEYRNGKTSLIGFFVAEVIKESKGDANPKEIVKTLKEIINSKNNEQNN